MNKTKTALIAYAAGIIDGEGCISIRKKPYKETNRILYTPRLSVGMNTSQPLDLLYGLFGGAIRMRRTTGGNVPCIFVWDIGCTKMQKTLKILLPFLRVKREQARLAIDFVYRVNNKHKATFYNNGNGIRRKFLSDHEMEKREQIWIRMRQLNKSRNVFPNAGAETERMRIPNNKYCVTVISDTGYITSGLCDSPTTKE